MTASRALTHFVDRRSKRLTGGKPAANHGRAVSTNDNAMRGPASGGQVERGSTDMRLQLGGSSAVIEPEGLRVDRPTPNKNGQAAPGPAVLVESCIDVYHKTLSQTLPSSRLTTRARHASSPRDCNSMLGFCPAFSPTFGGSWLNGSASHGPEREPQPGSERCRESRRRGVAWDHIRSGAGSAVPARGRRCNQPCLHPPR